MAIIICQWLYLCLMAKRTLRCTAIETTNFETPNSYQNGVWEKHANKSDPQIESCTRWSVNKLVNHCTSDSRKWTPRGPSETRLRYMLRWSKKNTLGSISCQRKFYLVPIVNCNEFSWVCYYLPLARDFKNIFLILFQLQSFNRVTSSVCLGRYSYL